MQRTRGDREGEEEKTEEEKASTDYTDYRITQIREELPEETEEA
jgi:hypothetical protein